MYEIDANKCTGCGACLKICPLGAIFLIDDIAQIDNSQCNECGKCLEVCPQDAIVVKKESEIEHIPIESAEPITTPSFSSVKTPIVQQRPILSQVVDFFKGLIAPQSGWDQQQVSPFVGRPQQMQPGNRMGLGRKGCYGRKMGRGSGRRKRARGHG